MRPSAAALPRHQPKISSTFRSLQTLQKTLLLLPLRNIQHDLHHLSPVADQMLLKCINVLKSLLPKRLATLSRRQLLPSQHRRMHPHNQYFLIPRAIEDSNAATLGHTLRISPKKSVIQLFRTRLLETCYPTALRVNPRHHMANCPILARCIHPLKNHQQRISIVCIQQLLTVRQLLLLAAQQLLSTLLHSLSSQLCQLHSLSPPGVMIRQLHPTARRHSKKLRNLLTGQWHNTPERPEKRLPLQTLNPANPRSPDRQTD